MAREGTFLERIAASASLRRGRYEPTTEDHVEAVMESVRRNLERLFNARHGMSEALPDYGLPALVDLTMGAGDHVRTLQQVIQKAIEKYEPRLRRVRVTPQANPDDRRGQTPVFRIEASLVARNGEHRVWYETGMRATGAFGVQG